MKKRQYFLIFLLVFGINHWLAAQQEQQETIINPVSLGVRTHYGFIIPHSVYIEDVSYSRPRGIGFDVSRLYTSEEAWLKAGCYSSLGIALNFYDFHNPSILGQSLTASFYAEPVWYYSPRFSVHSRAGIGLAYLSKVYDRQNNPENKFFSTKISFKVLLSLSMKYRITNHLEFELSGFYNHISNGGMKMPNKGMNFPTVSAGVNYCFSPVELKDRSYLKTRYKINEEWSKYLLFSTSVKNINARDSFPEKLCHIYGIGFGINYPTSFRSSLHCGIEYTYDGYVKEKIVRNELKGNHHRVAVLFGNEFLFGRFSFTQKLGVSVYAPKEQKPIYQRYGLWYKINGHLIVGSTLKARLQVADIFDFRIGIRF